MRVVQVPFGMHMFGGLGRIRGEVTDSNGPVGRRIHCFAENDTKPGNLKITQWFPAGIVQSDPVTGAYEIPYLGENHTFTLISFDPTGTYDPAIVGGKVPEPM